ncbi:MAG: hypothetical protein HY738_20120 [Bacteroidia bacterium]|nr:hypothetical protein [Bacteroidia bacterium]
MTNILNHNIMGLIREPLDVDFYFDPEPLTIEEKDAISKYIQEYKLKEKHKHLPKEKSIRLTKKRQKEMV